MRFWEGKAPAKVMCTASLNLCLRKCPSFHLGISAAYWQQYSYKNPDTQTSLGAYLYPKLFCLFVLQSVSFLTLKCFPPNSWQKSPVSWSQRNPRKRKRLFLALSIHIPCRALNQNNEPITSQLPATRTDASKSLQSQAGNEKEQGPQRDWTGNGGNLGTWNLLMVSANQGHVWKHVHCYQIFPLDREREGDRKRQRKTEREYESICMCYFLISLWSKQNICADWILLGAASLWKWL